MSEAIRHRPMPVLPGPRCGLPAIRCAPRRRLSVATTGARDLTRNQATAAVVTRCVNATTNAGDHVCSTSAFVSKSGTYRTDPTTQINTVSETASVPMGFVRNRGDFHPRPVGLPSLAGNAAHRQSRPRSSAPSLESSEKPDTHCSGLATEDSTQVRHQFTWEGHFNGAAPAASANGE